MTAIESAVEYEVAEQAPPPPLHLVAHRAELGGDSVYCRRLKRWGDVAMAGTALAALSPVLLGIAVAVRLDSPGGTLLRQTRIGRDGRPFTVYKFRTMVADRRVEDRPYEGPDRRRSHKTRNDPRVTRVGKLLRAASVDELPQLLNVWRGEMSVVGPRPELPQIVARYEPWQHARHGVRPGITGWWQVQGRSDRPMHEHTELDVYYVRNQGFRLDMEILLRTVRVVVTRSGAF